VFINNLRDPVELRNSFAKTLRTTKSPLSSFGEAVPSCAYFAFNRLIFQARAIGEGVVGRLRGGND